MGLKETNCGPSSKALIHGERTLDAVISWQKKGFLAGPFKLPPFKKLKVSSLIAVEKPNGDIRPCVNLSGPKGASYNDGIKESEVDKMWPMRNATARAVAWCIVACDRNAELGKADQEAAYKNVPIKLDQLYLQVFKILQRYFVELALIMGSKVSAAAYDRFHQVVIDLAIHSAAKRPNRQELVLPPKGVGLPEGKL